MVIMMVSFYATVLLCYCAIMLLYCDATASDTIVQFLCFHVTVLICY